MPENPTRIDGLDIDETEDGYIIYEPEKDRVHYLNSSAAAILELCNGANSSVAIAELLQQAYQLPEPPFEMVQGVLTQMKDEGLLL